MPLWIRTLTVALALGSLACGEEPQAAPVPPSFDDPRPDAVETGSGVALDLLEPVALELPPSSLPDDSLTASWPIRGPFRYAGSTKKGLHQWVVPLPVRPRGLLFLRPEPGMALTLDGAELNYSRFGPAEPMAWVHDRYEMSVYTPEREEPPSDGRLVLTWPMAEEREAALNLDASGKSPEDFHRATVSTEWDTLTGLLLPAPGRVVYEVTVPAAGELVLEPGIVPPEIDLGLASDGASLAVTVIAGGERTAVAQLNLEVGSFRVRHIDLSRFAGQTVQLELASSPTGTPAGGEGTPTLDYVFLGGPRVASRRSDPQRVVMVFIDTLRPDHMSLYGYERDTTASLDPLLENAAVFTEARSVAPWTLPSARTALTGRQPEDWSVATTLAEVIHARGEPTAFFAGNLYLSSEFGLNRGWDRHHVELWPSADAVTDQAIDWLDHHEGHGGLLQVHYMDPHLPYLEPPSHRDRYAAAEVPTGLREQFHLSDLRRLGDLDEASIQWMVDRYDNNVRYAADAVARLLGALDEDDIVVLYADHGEEFYEHGKVEHGHSLYDELLRVPLVIRAPGIQGGRIDTPVSLLDLTPTLLDLLEASVPDLDGVSLVPLASGDAAAQEAFQARPLGFGRLLYGDESWGLLDGGMKYVTTQGREALFNLAIDPGEAASLSTTDYQLAEPYRAKLHDVLDLDVAIGWRLQPGNTKPDDAKPVEAICSIPGGLRVGVASGDPLGNGAAVFREIPASEATATIASWEGADPDHVIRAQDTHLHLAWTGTEGREIVLEPNRGLREVGHEARCTARWCTPLRDARPCPTAKLRVEPKRDPGFGTFRTGLASAVWGRKRQLVWGFGILPVPPEGTALDATNPELSDALKAIGYVEGEEGE